MTEITEKIKQLKKEKNAIILTHYFPQKEFYLIRDDIVCTNMKWNSMEDIYEVLKSETNKIEIDSNVFEKANLCISGMMNSMKEVV